MFLSFVEIEASALLRGEAAPNQAGRPVSRAACNVALSNQRADPPANGSRLDTRRERSADLEPRDEPGAEAAEASGHGSPRHLRAARIQIDENSGRSHDSHSLKQEGFQWPGSHQSAEQRTMPSTFITPCVRDVATPAQAGLRFLPYQSNTKPLDASFGGARRCLRWDGWIRLASPQRRSPSSVRLGGQTRGGLGPCGLPSRSGLVALQVERAAHDLATLGKIRDAP